MSRSSFPAVLAYLAGDGAGSGLGGVWPGTPTFIAEPPQQPPGDFVAVSWAGPEAQGASASVRSTNMAASSSQESYSVVVQLVARQGTTDIAACIGRAFALLDELLDRLAADPTMGDAVALARVADWALPLDQTGRGALVTLGVTVAIEAFR